MAMAVSCTSPPLHFLSLSKPKSSILNLFSHGSPLPSTLSTGLCLKPGVYLQRNQLRKTQIWRTSVAPEEILPAEANPVEIVAPVDDGVGNIVSVLTFIAFIVLTLLTVGVVYIAVTDFLQKREREKFEKEETSKKKKGGGGKKGKVRARAGPRGFGQKIEELVDDD